MHLHATFDRKLIHQHLRCPIHEIVLIDRQKRQIGFQHDTGCVGSLHIDVVMELHGLHDHADIMITVRALPQHVERQIDFSIRLKLDVIHNSLFPHFVFWPLYTLLLF